jgi:hypothetical protein
VFLAFPNNQVLLVSEREADDLIKLFWKQAENATAKVSLSHLSLLRSSMDDKVPGLLPNSMVLGRKWGSSRMLWRSASLKWESPSSLIVATMQLFAGETMYPTEICHEALKEILRGPEVSLGPAVADPAHIVDARGNSHLLQYSDLENACRQLAREEQKLILGEDDVIICE